MDYEEFEKRCAEIRKVNDDLLELFADDLKRQDLSEKTIKRHITNADFYINEYLIRQDAAAMEEGIGMVDLFLGNFFIRKCVWSTPAAIKSTAASIKKFYKSMLDHGKIKKKDYEYLCDEIRDGMEGWQMDCEIYNDSDEENPFAWF